MFESHWCLSSPGIASPSLGNVLTLFKIILPLHEIAKLAHRFFPLLLRLASGLVLFDHHAIEHSHILTDLERLGKRRFLLVGRRRQESSTRLGKKGKGRGRRR